MAATKAFLTAVLIAAIAAPAFATDYMVGDDEGWKIGVNYTQWAQGKDFRVGDTLMFMYNKDNHNVAKVNVTDFRNCSSSNSSNLLKSGQDTITLATTGRKWYICSVNDHCSKGMKLVIDVAADGPAPAPSAATQVSSMKTYLLMLVPLAVMKLVMA